MRRIVFACGLLLSACGDSPPVAPGPPPAAPVVVPTGAVIDLSVDAQGIVTLGGKAFDLEHDREVALEGVLSALLRILEHEPDAAPPSAPVTVRLAAAHRAPWRYVHWLRQVTEHAALAKYDLRFETEVRSELEDLTSTPTYPAPDEGTEPRELSLTIHLSANGEMTFDGKTYNLQGDPHEQETAIAGLRAVLLDLVRQDPTPGDRSDVEVLVRGQREARWQWVQWIMHVAAHPTIGIHNVQFAVETPEGASEDAPADEHK